MDKFHTDFKFKVERTQPVMHMSDDTHDWELDLVTLSERKDPNNLITVYVCMEDNKQIFAETFKGAALSRFMSLIPNKVVNK